MEQSSFMGFPLPRPDKRGSVVFGKQWATGTVTATNNFNITGLSFIPSMVFYYKYNTSADITIIGVAMKDGSMYYNATPTNNVVSGVASGGIGFSNFGSPTWGVSGVTGLFVNSSADAIRWYAFE